MVCPQLLAIVSSTLAQMRNPVSMAATDTTTAEWLSVLDDTRRRVAATDDLDVVASGVEVAWRTARAVTVPEDLASENWWAYLAEAIGDAAEELQRAGVPLTLGAGTAPTGPLSDQAVLRDAAAQLATALHAGLTRSVAAGAEPAAALAAAHAAARVERALVTGR